MRLLCLAPKGCRNLASEPRRRDGLCDECRARRKARSAARAAVEAATEALIHAARRDAERGRCSAGMLAALERLDAACRKAAEVGS